ncbi:hypothetical protein E3U43_010376 [Larimichthys crocea]|uniref:Uncharacterized protein n=1 Tax=Larimichthys crocea TaxID=215358 RepID=A0ACD3RFC0_LARCR|nr:hypothetical protein E3U43_010376 [Larimichthys crocea]
MMRSAESLSRHTAFWDSLELSPWAVPPADKPGGSGGAVLNEDCAGCQQACFCREMIPHEVRRTRPPVVLGGSSRCDVVTLSPTTLRSPFSR